MRNLATGLAVVAALVLADVHPSAQRGQIGRWLPRVEAWIAAVQAHEIGKADDAAKRIGAWANDDLELIGRISRS